MLQNCYFCGRGGVSRGARHGKNWQWPENSLLTHIFPLYAFRGEKRDQNCPKVTHIFPLYAFRGEKRDQN